MKNPYFIANCYEVNRDRVDGDMTWEVGRKMDRSRICLCYSEADAQQIVDGLMLLQKQLKKVKDKKG